MIQRMLAIWSLVSLPFLNPAWISGSSWFTYCWSLTWRILSVTLLAWEMSAIAWQSEHSLALPFFGIGMKTDLFQSCAHCGVFQISKAEQNHLISQCSQLQGSLFNSHLFAVHLKYDLWRPTVEDCSRSQWYSRGQRDQNVCLQRAYILREERQWMDERIARSVVDCG